MALSNQKLIVTEGWNATLSELCSSDSKDLRNRVVAVVGPKNVGKSTFARELCRRWLVASKRKERIAFLDTDLGRPEFTLGGVVSLHSFDAKSNHKLVGAIFLGEDDPSQRPESYVQATKRLAELALSRFDLIVINTHGWFAGLGQDVLEAVLVNSSVTDVVQIIPESKLLTLGSLLKPSQSFSVWTLVPAKEGRQRESKSSIDGRYVDHFSRGRVHAVGLKRVSIRYPVGIIDHALPPGHALLAVNAAIVGLTKGGDSDDPENYLGMGLVLSLDLEKELLFIQTPVSTEEIMNCTTLILATSVRVPLKLLNEIKAALPSAPSVDSKQLSIDDFQSAYAEDPFVPYLTSCRLVGYGGTQPQKGILKRRRLEDS